MRFIFISFGCQCAGNWEIRKYYTRFWLVNAHLNANTHAHAHTLAHINLRLQFMCVRAWVLYALFAVDNISYIFYDVRFDFMNLLLCHFFTAVVFLSLSFTFFLYLVAVVFHWCFVQPHVRSLCQLRLNVDCFPEKCNTFN